MRESYQNPWGPCSTRHVPAKLPGLSLVGPRRAPLCPRPAKHRPSSDRPLSLKIDPIYASVRPRLPPLFSMRSMKYCASAEHLCSTKRGYDSRNLNCGVCFHHTPEGRRTPKASNLKAFSFCRGRGKPEDRSRGTGPFDRCPVNPPSWG